MFKNYKDDISLAISSEDFNKINGNTINYIKENYPSLYSLLVSSNILTDRAKFSDNIYTSFIRDGKVPLLSALESVADTTPLALSHESQYKLDSTKVNQITRDDNIDFKNFVPLSKIYYDQN